MRKHLSERARRGRCRHRRCLRLHLWNGRGWNHSWNSRRLKHLGKAFRLYCRAGGGQCRCNRRWRCRCWHYGALWLRCGSWLGRSREPGCLLTSRDGTEELGELAGRDNRRSRRHGCACAGRCNGLKDLREVLCRHGRELSRRCRLLGWRCGRKRGRRYSRRAWRRHLRRDEERSSVRSRAHRLHGHCR